MSKSDDGGEAFPCPGTCDGSMGPHNEGMKLRDWFAGMAMQGLIQSTDVLDLAQKLVERGYGDTVRQLLSEKAYEYANAMIAEKRRSEGGAA
jgi:hypothetical protein